jgi:MFS family permease
MTRVFYGYFTAGLVDVLNGAVILSFPYVALYLNAGRMGTIANIISVMIYAVVCLVLSKVKIFEERRYKLAVGLFVYFLGCMIIVCVKNRFTLLGVPVLLAVANALFYPALQTWFTEGMERPQLIKTIGGYSIAWVIGFLIGPSVGGYIISSDIFGVTDLNGKLNILFSGAGIIALITGISFVPDIYKQKILALSENEIPAIFKKEISQEKCRLFLHMMWIATFCAFFMGGFVRLIFTEMGKEESLSPFVIGNINSIMYLGLIFLVFFLKYHTFWLFSFRYLLFFQLLSLPAIFFFIFTKSVVLYFTGAVIFGFLIGFTFFSSSFYSLIFEGKRDKYISINEALVGIGSFMSGLLGYVFAGFISIKYSFFPGIIVFLIVVLAEIILYRRGRKAY